MGISPDYVLMKKFRDIAIAVLMAAFILMCAMFSYRIVMAIIANGFTITRFVGLVTFVVNGILVSLVLPHAVRTINHTKY